LPFCTFFRRLGNLVAGFLAIRLSFLAMPFSPSHQDVPPLGPSSPDGLNALRHVVLGVVDQGANPVGQHPF
jgi:hypothetical protein